MAARTVQVLQSVQAWMDERIQITERMRFVLYKPVPLHATRFWYCFGGLTLFLLGVQLVSGAFLAFYYVPEVSKAYSSTYYITHDVAFGWFVRSLHYWGCQLMIVMLVLHMARVYYTKSYAAPREMGWLTGVVQFVGTMGLGFTGYVLPWHETAFWAGQVSTQMMKETPLIGPTMQQVILGGDQLSQVTLSHFFALHVFILPAVLIGSLVLHFYLVRRQGISGPL